MHLNISSRCKKQTTFSRKKNGGMISVTIESSHDKANKVIYVPSKGLHQPGSVVIKLFSCSSQQSTEFIMLINVKMPTIVGILTFISMINTTPEYLKARKVFFSVF